MRYSINLSFYLFGLILLMISCEKQEFIADPGTPVFMADIPFLNDEDFNVVAGDELYYMFASHQDLDDSVLHGGLFGKEDICEESCAENFAIKIVKRYGIQETLITPGKYDFYSIPKNGFKHRFSMHSSDEQALNWTSWRLDDQSVIGQPSISFDSNNGSQVQDGIQLIYNVPGQFVARFERAVVPKASECTIGLKISRVVNQGVFLEISTDSPFAFVNWSNGITGNKIKIDFNSQSYAANVFDASGCQTKIIVHFKTQNIIKDYEIGLNQNSQMFSTPDNSDRSVIIEYTDKEGAFYTSSIIGQILPFKFNIQSVEDYEINELNEPTWKIDANFDCILFGENGSTKRIVDGKAVFAVSY